MKRVRGLSFGLGELVVATKGPLKGWTGRVVELHSGGRRGAYYMVNFKKGETIANLASRVAFFPTNALTRFRGAMASRLMWMSSPGRLAHAFAMGSLHSLCRNVKVNVVFDGTKPWQQCARPRSPKRRCSRCAAMELRK